ncbi:McrB family protein [Candidatus Poriferisodalis sp.]|uniref:McrB family protein n=1 Tax=Candidatus Poriferisodalis sp. TaxID=3101277 RepID=UPI003C6EE343
MSQKGIGSATATRLPAICHPERFIPNYVLARSSSDNWRGKLEMIELVDELGLLGVAGTREAQEIHLLHREHGGSGAVVMRANDLLLESLRPYFTDDDVVDTWGIRSFLSWLEDNYGDSDETADQWIDDAERAELADNLLCDPRFIMDIVELLEDKGQVILYGPPGTGKTYFARYLAWTLTGIQDDEEYEENGPYSLVQFHPAYSYEDFFEGFRPRVEDGQLTYKLTSGPLVRLAKRAEENPHERHVMVIDEINRANLPRVLGELLYLLEYRGEWIQTQYRPDEGFTLPSNLWFIGTMNTADRSIALIDAAMRRRFHFVPFFPNHGLTAGLLRRWMQRNSPEQEWIASMVDKVNDELAEQVGGDHSLIGPSYFMKKNLNEDSLRRIWEYNIEPLVEDQFFGQRDVIDGFRFGSIWKRHGPNAILEAAESQEETPEQNEVEIENGG